MKIVRRKLELKKNINADIVKWAHVNNVSSKGLDFGPGNDRLTDQVKDYVLYSFAIALSQNKENVLGLQRTIRSIGPHAFENHELYGDWCGYKKDPKSFSHKNLPGG